MKFTIKELQELRKAIKPIQKKRARGFRKNVEAQRVEKNFDSPSGSYSGNNTYSNPFLFNYLTSQKQLTNNEFTPLDKRLTNAESLALNNNELIKKVMIESGNKFYNINDRLNQLTQYTNPTIEQLDDRNSDSYFKTDTDNNNTSLKPNDYGPEIPITPQSDENKKFAYNPDEINYDNYKQQEPILNINPTSINDVMNERKKYEDMQYNTLKSLAKQRNIKLKNPKKSDLINELKKSDEKYSDNDSDNEY
jgi:hypothetical protein